ncbi:hypothetical protein C7S20_16310 [Christiangramia fulva]|uniref:Uncharacterized protein n=1 Tax=Christiangramia fulva TaxID=2126553 RepID=A0A2R3Z8W8_9FLAO|nr:hypothetical protein [Christiangramia fulva]AVR46703.1 hypothetical protein C7S20_16310 [Christiangramia fulva]
MADIRVEKRKPIWPWILLIVIIAVVVFLFIYGSDDDDNEEIQTEEMEDVTSVNTQDFLQLKDVEQIKKIDNHEYTRKTFV